MPSEALTWRRLSFSPRLSRRTSRILRMATRGLVNCCSSDGLSEEPAEQGLPRASCYESLLNGSTKTSESVIGFDRNGCTEWLEIRNTAVSNYSGHTGREAGSHYVNRRRQAND